MASNLGTHLYHFYQYDGGVFSEADTGWRKHAEASERQLLQTYRYSE